jgi:hypothetical protein
MDSNNAADAASLFDHVLRDAFAPIGAFHERPHIMLALATSAGEQNIGGSFSRNELVWTTGQFDDGHTRGESLHDFEHVPHRATKWFLTEFAPRSGTEEKQLIECEPRFAGHHDDIAQFARDECAPQKCRQTASKAPIAKTRNAVKRTNVRPHGAGQDFRIEIVEARELGITES